MAAKDGHVMNVVSWLTDPANWTGSGGIPAQVGYHLLYSAVALLIALAIAIPLGIVIGYTGRGEALVAGFANALRALPSLGLLVLLFLIIAPVAAGKLVYLPLMVSGVRSSTLQIVSTATIAAYLGLQGLGRFILDGRAQASFAEMAGGAILVAVLAILLEFTFAWIGRIIVSPGLRRVVSKESSPLATTVLEPAT
jgi:osmoprotectant transport system permease protein